MKAAIRRGGAVRRFHTERAHTTQTNAAHSWGVAVLLHHFYPELTNERTLLWALYHDVTEGVVGDLPAPAKWNHPELRRAYEAAEAQAALAMGLALPTLHEDERTALGLCDLLEATLFALEEQAMGNRYFGPVVIRARAELLVRGAPQAMLTYLDEWSPRE